MSAGYLEIAAFAATAALGIAGGFLGYYGKELLGETKKKIAKPPAARLLVALQFVFPRRAYERIFSQIVADFREEYFEAVNNGDIFRARWLAGCLYVNLIWTTVFWVATSIVKKLYDLYKLG